MVAAGMLAAVAGAGDFFIAAPAAAATAPPVVPPLPDTVSGVANPRIPIASGWRYTTTPPASFWTTATDTSTWAAVSVPGEPAMQGQNVPTNQECAYSVKVPVPADYAGRTVLLRFDGVYSYARLWVNGTLVTTHEGGFTTWYANITSLVTPGQQATVTLGVTDGANTISRESYYAKHNIGGILRDVTLVALPASHLTRLHTDTTFDASYTNATLTVTAAAALAAGKTGTVALTLTNPDGQPVPLTPAQITLTGASPQQAVAIPVNAPRKWDAEHPHLYTLNATFTVDGVTQTVTRAVGFRQLKIQGNQQLVNGKPIHLLGVCHHSMSPLQGRSANATLEEQAVRLYKEANCNYIRTSHYPPTPGLLEWADRLGLYVEVEAPVTFQPHTVDDPAYSEQYLTQFAEMIERDRSHACVVQWSLGNESSFGNPLNFRLENTYAHENDPSRPTVFEEARVVNGGNQADIYSGHYPSLANATGNPNQPVQYGEFGHVACYNNNTLQADPSVRDFWGYAIDKFAERFRTANGVVGGAIWAAIDEAFHLPQGPVGYGEWGIIDLWRRPKPEFWLTKKAFSPVRITDGVLTGLTPGGAIAVPVKNWYDHSDLGELTITWDIGTRSGTLTGVAVPARQSGTLTIPAGPWSAGDTLHLTFRRGAAIVDEYRLWLNARPTPQFTAPGGTTPTIQQTATQIVVTGVDVPFTVVFDKTTARLVDAKAGGRRVLTAGPDLVLSRGVAGPWTGTSATATTTGGQAVVTLTGRFGTVNTSFTISIDGRGLLTTTYTIANPPSGPFSDVGVRFSLAGAADTLTWQRDAQWTVYPNDHIGRPAGTATRTRTAGTDAYRTQPTWPWAQDTHSYYLFGKDSAPHWTNDFRSAKSNIRLAKVTTGATSWGVQVESDGTEAIRLAPARLTVDDASADIVYTGPWTHADRSAGYTAGDLFDTESWTNTAGATAQLTFTGTGVDFYSAMNTNLGIVKVYIDGTLASTIDLYKGWRVPAQMVFSSGPLAYGQHTIKVECTGTKNASATGTYALIDAFEVVNSVIDNTSDRISYSGAWTHAAGQPWSTGDLNGTESYSNQTGDTATATFRGTGIRVIAPKNGHHGIVEISIDGAAPTQVDLYAPAKQFQQTVFERTGLPDGEHTITVRVTGNKNTSSSGTYAVIDAFQPITPDPYANSLSVDLIVSAKINYPDLGWGNYVDPAITLPANWSATTRLRLLP
ncbi:glycoside hydrolase family 2 TIM barrel-domain containing protein [Kitasatospora sp. NPDC058201]|uniref:glycoside hydrolase family 2 TIM barrel-domain containing protein n=1 Tax=unclassified Kitasatospora TaxID=2633591 RepID=UPI0036502843